MTIHAVRSSTEIMVVVQNVGAEGMNVKSCIQYSISVMWITNIGNRLFAKRKH